MVIKFKCGQKVDVIKGKYRGLYGKVTATGLISEEKSEEAGNRHLETMVEIAGQGTYVFPDSSLREG